MRKLGLGYGCREVIRARPEMVAGPRRDGPGNDAISARNGKEETLDCGSGKKDVAIIDKKDRTKRCEKVERAKK